MTRAEFCGVCGDWKCAEDHAAPRDRLGLRLVDGQFVPPAELVAWFHPLVSASRGRCQHGFVIAEPRGPDVAWAGGLGFCRCCLTFFGYIGFGMYGRGDEESIEPDPWLCPECGWRAAPLQA